MSARNTLLSLLLLTVPAAFADRPPSLDGCSVLPADNIWNTPVDRLPVESSSLVYVATIGPTRTLFPDFGSGTFQGGPIGIPFVAVPGTQTTVPVSFLYHDESDPGPYPIPSGVPIEGGSQSDGDRHAIVLDRDRCILYEIYRAFPAGSSGWRADSGAIFDLRSNRLRPETWTSADAAGLPILPGLVRYEEILEGEIRHAIRFTAAQTRRAYVWPARHYASSLTDPKYPPMGQRFRLKAGFDTSGFSRECQIILRALQKYGMILADNGSAWYISGAPDERWNNDRLRELRRVLGSDFEAVDSSSLMVSQDSGQARQLQASLHFAQVALGGGYATRFALVNVGSDAAEGTLTLRASDGSALEAAWSEGAAASSLKLSIPAGAARFLTATLAGELARRGWASLESAGGTLAGVSTLDLAGASGLQSTAGVLGGAPVRSAVVPIDNDDNARRFTGYACANPGGEPVRITFEILDSNGVVIDTLTPAAVNPLAPGAQAARFVHEDRPAARTFRGSLLARGDREFVMVALVEAGGLLTAVPVQSRPN